MDNSNSQYDVIVDRYDTLFIDESSLAENAEVGEMLRPLSGSPHNCIETFVASHKHYKYVPFIINAIEKASKDINIGIAKRSPNYIRQKMQEGKAIIALDGKLFAGFSYIETWEHESFISTSGLIIPEEYRGIGLSKKIKAMTFLLARTKWPKAKIFSLTTSGAVIKMNNALCYHPVTFADLTTDEEFWKGCEGCSNVGILHRTGRKYCICTAMLYEKEKHPVDRLSVILKEWAKLKISKNGES